MWKLRVRDTRTECRGRSDGASRLRAVASVAAAASVSVGGVVVLAPSAAAYPSAVITLDGHGYGHGRGMGQWGAFGYALAQTSWQSILEHYYSGSTPTPLNPTQQQTLVRVALTENNGNDVRVTSSTAFTVGTAHVAGGTAIRMQPTGSGTWNLMTGPICDGPWATPFASAVRDPQAVPDATSLPGDPNASARALQLCQAGGNLSMRGYIRATTTTTGGTPQARTVNVVPLESYVAGVVPNESPAYWGQLGGPGPQAQAWGFQELEAQAVAARSYVMAALGSYGGYADICDLACQTYRGLGNENPLTNAATLATAGFVMETGGNGIPLTTEYSSSTGGYSAAGKFPAVPDAGDPVCPPGVNGACNPNHTWQTTVAVASVESTWPQLGTLQSISVTNRNGHGEWGGRVLSMTLTGSSQSVVITGDQFAAACNLRSNWFTLFNSLSSPAVAMATSPDGKGYWINGSDGSVAAYGSAKFLGSMAGVPLSAPVVGMAETADGGGYWEVASDGGIFSFGDAQFYGSTGALRLNKPIVGMARTPGGAGYWLVASDGGIFAFGDAAFYGSTGSIRLNLPVVGMARTDDGHGYWLVASDGGIFAFGDARFYGSMGGQHLNKPVVGMSSAPGGAGYWMDASDGGIFSFGSATFLGSAGALPLVRPVVGMTRTPDGSGYWMVASDGGLFSYGSAGFYGSAAG